MAHFQNLLKAATGFAALGMMAACGQAGGGQGHVSTMVDCIAIDEGNYVFQNGKFTRVTAPATSRVEAVIAPPAARAWFNDIEDSFDGAGYGWMRLNVRRNTATLIGLAPDTETKAAAFALGKAAVLAAPEGALLNVIDGISVEGGEVAVGAALAELDDTPSLASCQKAFVDTMQNRNVQFRIGSATILPDSAGLLDAVSGVATLCNAYNIEIGGHTDRLGDDTTNMRLSQQRANSVRDYLARRGVDISSIQAVGYGETRPIDNSGTRVGDALNRRTEFTVTTR